MYRKILSHFYKQVEESHLYIKSLSQKWDIFEKKDTYLTSREKNQFNFSSILHYPNIICDILSHLIFDAAHKNMLLERNILISRLQERIKSYNDLFVERRLREYAPLFEDDHLNAPLDRDQRRAVIVDDQHNLVVAAAGSGKTSVLTSRIAYLVKRTDAIAKQKILALAFTKSAAQEMKTRLKANFAIDVDMTTFHGLGYAILRENGIRVDDVKEAEKLIDELFPNLIKTNHRLQQLFIEYISIYLQEVHTAADFQTPEEYFQYMKNQRYLTLSGIQVKSLAEKEIANFFFMHDILFEYEKLVTWLPQHTYKRYHPDFYLPQYDIYIEHWGLDRHGQTAPWIDAEEYKRTRAWKLMMFRQHRKVLIETWEYERTEGTLIDHLKRSLQTVHPSIQFQQLPYTELVSKVYAPQQDKALQVKKLLTTVITHAKSNFLTPYDLDPLLGSRRREI